MLRKYMHATAAVLSFAIYSSTSFAWQSATTELSPGLAQITEGKVTAAISFLASDELAGRATGSNEFNIAASYVASRFRGAGLTGGATDGSFYHETLIRMTQTPEQITVADTTNKPLPNFGLLSAGQEAVQFSGALTTIDLSKEIPAKSVTGVVGGMLPSDIRGPRGMAQIARLANAVADAGASALLLGVPDDSEYIAMAKGNRERPRMEGRNRIALAVVLVPASTLESKTVSLNLPAAINTEFPMRNVVGVLKGTDDTLSQEAVLFSAHLDHLGSRPMPGDGIFNGADDDATGVTAVVTLADAIAAMPKPKRSVLFITYWGEESGLLGSKQYVTTPTWPLEKIVANVNIEMIGRPEPGAGGKIWMTGWQESDLGTLMNKASSSFGVEIFDHPKFGNQLYRASDNWSFVEKGVIAHSFSAGSLHGDYHQPSDEWTKLEIPHMTRVIQGLFAGSQPLLQGEVTPTKTKAK